MLRGLFPRVFSNFRECGLIHAKFVVATGGAAPVYTLKSAKGLQNYQGLSLTGTTSSLTLVLAGGARSISCLDFRYVNIATPATPANYRLIGLRAAIIEANPNGQVLASILQPTDGALANSVATDEIHVTLMCDK